MKHSLVTALLLGLAVAAGAAGCSQKSNLSPSSSSDDSVGTVGMQLTLAPGVTLDSVNWTVTNAALLGAPRTGTVDVSHSQSIRFVVGGLPAGAGYTISLTGKTSNGLDCLGSATFTVTAGVTSAVALNLVCGGGNADGGNNGSVAVNGTTTIASGCAAVTSLSASASDVDVGYSLSLAAAGINSQGSTTGLSFAWAVSGGTGTGTFSSATSAAPTFTCTGAGPVTVTVTATVGTGGTCANNTGSVDLQCDAPAGSPDAGSPTPDAGSTAPDSGSPTPDAGSPTPDAGSTAPDSGTASACAPFNGGAGCTPTEQRLVAKSPACYQCMVNGGCLDDVQFGDTGHECGDVTGSAAKGAKTGTARSQLCLDTLDCILNPAKLCASSDVNICYCGSLGAGNGCATGTTPDTTAACFQQEVDGLEHLAADAPSAVLPDYTDLSRGAGMANQLFVCAKSNGCDTLCAQ